MAPKLSAPGAHALSGPHPHVGWHLWMWGGYEVHIISRWMAEGRGLQEVIKDLNQHLGGPGLIRQEGAEVRDRSQEETEAKTNCTVLEQITS